MYLKIKEEASNWVEKEKQNKKMFYYNRHTMKGTWKRPECLGLLEQIDDLVKQEELESYVQEQEWVEKKTSFGKVFYHNIRKDLFRFSKPRVARSGKNKLKENDKFSGLTREEAKLKMFDFFEGIGVEPTTKFERVNELFRDNKHFHLVKKTSDKKKMFKEYLEYLRKVQHEEMEEEIRTKKRRFFEMMEENKTLTSETKYSTVVPYFYLDERWKAIDDRIKEEYFLEFLQSLVEKEKILKKEMIQAKCKTLRGEILLEKKVNSHTTWNEMQKIMHYSVVWNDLHEYHRLKVFAELMKSYHQMEEQENQKDKQVKARHFREDLRLFLEKMIISDRFTFRSKYKEIFPVLKDEEAFYHTLMEEYSSPREVFLLYKGQLMDDHRKIKEVFKNLLKGNLSHFPVGMEFEAFQEILKKEIFFQKLDAEKESNSFEYYAQYLFDKMQKRQEKSVLKFMMYLYNESEIRNSKLNAQEFLKSIERKQLRHSDKSYFESISVQEKIKWVKVFQETIKQGKSLKALIRKRKGIKKSKQRSDQKNKQKGRFFMC